jgi:hypothetical protein
MNEMGATLVRAHNRRHKGLRMESTGLARLSEKYMKGVKKRAERSELDGDSSCITWTVKRQNNTSRLGPHLLWITL